MLDGSNQIKVKPGSRVKVELVRARREGVAQLDPANLHGRAPVAPVRHQARFAMHDLGTYYAVNGDNASSYQESNTETGRWNDTDRASVRYTYLDNLRTATVGGSNRIIERCVRMQAGSTETDGVITALLLKQADVTRRYDMIAASQTWTEQIPAAQRLAAVEALPPGASSSVMDRVAAGIRAESLESWEPYSANRTGADGTLIANLADGKYQIAVDSPRHFYPFDTSDLVAYKVTDEPSPGAVDAPVPDVIVGNTASTRVDVWLVPQIYQTIIQWYTRYVYMTLFSYGFFIVPQTGTYFARLPFYPLRYNLNFAGTLTNAVAMSERIRRTETYARMIRQDLALQVVSRFFILLLFDRIVGRWTLFQRDIPAGQLVGVLRFRYQGGPAVMRYVWRRTTLTRENVAIDSGPLNVPGEVVGDDGSIVIEPF